MSKYDSELRKYINIFQEKVNVLDCTMICSIKLPHCDVSIVTYAYILLIVIQDYRICPIKRTVPNKCTPPPAIFHS